VIARKRATICNQSGARAVRYRAPCSISVTVVAGQDFPAFATRVIRALPFQSSTCLDFISKISATRFRDRTGGIGADELSFGLSDGHCAMIVPAFDRVEQAID